MAKTYSRAELARATGVTDDGLRNLVRHGLLARARGGGSSAHYTEEHVARVRRVVALRAQGVRGRALAAALAQEDRARAAALAQEERARAAAQRDATVKTIAPTPAERDAAEALLAVAAEALDVSPRALRPALARVLRRVHERGLSPLRAAELLEG